MDDLMTTQEAEQEVMPSFNFLLAEECEQQTLVAEHRAWLKSIKHERPMPKHHFKVAVYIRYFNQTRYEDYLSVHKKQFLDTISLCPNWEFAGFYIDEGGTAPNMENADAWSELLQHCYEGKVDLIITQKASNVSKKVSEGQTNIQQDLKVQRVFRQISTLVAQEAAGVVLPDELGKSTMFLRPRS